MKLRFKSFNYSTPFNKWPMWMKIQSRLIMKDQLKQNIQHKIPTQRHYWMDKR